MKKSVLIFCIPFFFFQQCNSDDKKKSPDDVVMSQEETTMIPGEEMISLPFGKIEHIEGLQKALHINFSIKSRPVENNAQVDSVFTLSFKNSQLKIYFNSLYNTYVLIEAEINDLEIPVGKKIHTGMSFYLLASEIPQLKNSKASTIRLVDESELTTLVLRIHNNQLKSIVFLNNEYP